MDLKGRVRVVDIPATASASEAEALLNAPCEGDHYWLDKIITTGLPDGIRDTGVLSATNKEVMGFAAAMRARLPLSRTQRARLSGKYVDRYAGYYFKSNLQGLCRPCHYDKTLEDKAHVGAWPDVVERERLTPKKVWAFA